MSPSLHALLSGIVDYAGLFPPAQLPLDQAIANYIRYRSEADRWMLGRFICPAARLTELAPFLGGEDLGNPPMRISALGRGGKDSQQILDGTRADIEAIAEFKSRNGDTVVVDALELRWPAGVIESPSPTVCSRLLDNVVELIRSSDPSALNLVYEAGFGRNWQVVLKTLIDSQGQYRLARDAGQRETRIAFKIRCGGLEAPAFPSTTQVAFALAACRDAGVPVKATAGLHHPIRRFDTGLQVWMHGFLNLFVAGILGQCHALEPSQLEAILEDEEASSFRFDEHRISWRDLTASTDAITWNRQNTVLSFGSCSFDEPREDLRALGLLGDTANESDE
jgi:hypothetical protein